MPFQLIPELSHPITALADRPAGSAQSLKAYFDGNAQTLLEAANALILALGQPDAAAQIGASPLPGVPGSTVQQMLASLKSALDEAATGGIPEGSISMDKLSPGVQQAIARPYTYGTQEPTDGQDGDLYFRYSG